MLIDALVEIIQPEILAVKKDRDIKGILRGDLQPPRKVLNHPLSDKPPAHVIGAEDK